MRETFVLSVVADAILLAATRNLGKRNDRKSLGEAGRVSEQLQNILLPWSSSPNTIQLITSEKEALPFSVDKRGASCNKIQKLRSGLQSLLHQQSHKKVLVAQGEACRLK